MLIFLVAIVATGCFRTEGTSPPSELLNFPIASAALTLDAAEGPRFLFVANSNFDLRYNSATLQSYDLEVANRAVDDLCTPVLPPPGCRGPIPPPCTDPSSPACQAITQPTHAACAIVPHGSRQATLSTGLLRICELAEAEQLLVDEVRIGSFAAGMQLDATGRRLYLPIRSDADVTRVDIDAEGRMDCGEGFGTSGLCLSAFRRSNREVASSRGLSLPPDPTALFAAPVSNFTGHAASVANYVVVAHRAGSMSYFLDPMDGSPLILLDVLPGFPTAILTLSREPDSGLLWGPSSLGGTVGRIGLSIDESFAEDELIESFAFNAGELTVPFLATGTGGDLREVVFDPRPGSDRAYAISRSPASLLIGSRHTDFGTLLVRSFLPDQVIRVGAGPARIRLAELETSSGPRLFAFVSCYDSREIHVVDVDLGRIAAVAREFSGPFEIEVDTVRNRLYVIDFRTSVIRLLDLSPTLECLDGTVPASAQECSPALAGLIGVPEAAEELQ